MTKGEFQELIRLGCEAPALEFKPPARRDEGRVAAEVARAALALANRRGGGRIIIGVAEDQAAKTLARVGLTQKEVDQLRQIIAKERGVVLSNQEAWERAIELMAFAKMLAEAQSSEKG